MLNVKKLLRQLALLRFDLFNLYRSLIILRLEERLELSYVLTAYLIENYPVTFHEPEDRYRTIKLFSSLSTI